MILCFDTATPAFGVTLADAKKVHAFKPLPFDKMSESIVKVTADLLAEAKVEPRALQGIAVVVGPGSFTSLRVGLTVANQFAHELGVPILGVRTEELYAAAVEGSRDFIFAQSMNRDEAYAVGFGRYEKQVPRAIHTLEELALIAETVFTGPLWSEHETILSFWKKQPVEKPYSGWPKLIQNWHATPKAQYEVLEPYYGKDPTITKPKSAF
jgi:tRNA threonylcarbamoyladenosine biosynthesis protein TsaB